MTHDLRTTATDGIPPENVQCNSSHVKLSELGRKVPAGAVSLAQARSDAVLKTARKLRVPTWSRFV